MFISRIADILMLAIIVVTVNTIFIAFRSIMLGNNRQAEILVPLLSYIVVPTVNRLRTKQQRQFIVLLQMLLLLLNKLSFQ